MYWNITHCLRGSCQDHRHVLYPPLNILADMLKVIEKEAGKVRKSDRYTESFTDRQRER